MKVILELPIWIKILLCFIILGPAGIFLEKYRDTQDGRYVFIVGFIFLFEVLLLILIFKDLSKK